ncbi:hypothetical protein EA796_00860 [Pseudomonas sp. AOB-7]|uniref:hypothetical protein n=1 Tax=Pseudomonas sp. AOB-7 TaxID=2482750 RepID=UPI000EFBA154|nr:hypothetical protein [Pseudomonas sp. AOB-7]RMH86412.1 hypothetical protein EA796_00860 [Pseudomonas sp. AOB-7]
MKFVYRSFKKSFLCFAITPALMLLAVVLTLMGKLSADTEIPDWFAGLLNWRYSADDFFVALLIGCMVCGLTALLIETQPLPRREKYFIAKAYDLTGSFIAKNFFFWGGVFFAWSFGSRLIPFIERVPAQEVMVPLFIVAGIAIEYGLIKFKHQTVRA